MPKSRKSRPERKLKTVLHIYCEGAKTEPNYIQGYLDRYFPTNRRLKVVRIEDTKKNTPKQLVSEAVNAKKKAKKVGLNDSYWVIYDRESKAKYSDDLHCKAYATAKKNDVSVAISNICFEVWLILHFTYTTAAYSCYDDLRNNSPLRPKLKAKGVDQYDKGEKGIFDHFTEQEIQMARDHAKKMNQQTEQGANPSLIYPYQLNPYTDVYKLLDNIDEIAKENDS